jgi:hypothetical protein
MLVLAVQLGRGQLFPAWVAPTSVPMRLDSPPDPTVEPLEEFADLGAFVILAPTPQERIQLRNQLLGPQR